ncbi:transcriptional regulator whib-like whiB7 [Mycobacterium tuberculosis T17]|nr:transcriptional regulator whib-like whiB7 [Mycobacterium tuberculosis T17]
MPVLPCHVGDPDLWFADTPAGLEVAKTLCVSCPIRRQCLAAALQRAEPWAFGVVRYSTKARS